MLRDATGQYVASVAGGEAVRAFVPDSLPPVPPLDLGGTRQALLEKATLALGHRHLSGSRVLHGRAGAIHPWHKP